MNLALWLDFKPTLNFSHRKRNSLLPNKGLVQLKRGRYKLKQGQLKQLLVLRLYFLTPYRKIYKNKKIKGNEIGRRGNESLSGGYRYADECKRLERSKQYPFLQKFKIAHKHIRISSVTREPLAELTTEASQIPMVKNLEVCFLNQIFPLQVEAECIFTMLP